jgi:hypothetical protein
MRRLTGCALLAWLLATAAPARAEVLIRWDQDDVPSIASLGIPALVVPGANRAAIRSAVAQGYRVYVEGTARALSALALPPSGFAGVIVRGDASAAELALLRSRVGQRGRVIILDERGKWPLIRSNSVTRRQDVLQVSSRSAQPWIENNAALIRIVRTLSKVPAATANGGDQAALFLTYRWPSDTQSEQDEGPDVENYLVAISEAGSFGGDLVLPLHPRFEKDLLLGLPQARAAWQRIRRYVDFYSWDLPGRYVPVANVGVVTGNPLAWFEVMNLLSRHNLPFRVIEPSRLADAARGLDALIVLDSPTPDQFKTLDTFARRGATIVLDVTGAAGPPAASLRPWSAVTPLLTTEDRVSYKVGEGRVVEVRKGIADPDKFALEIREVLGPARRPVDIWNGITVIAAPYTDPDGRSTLVSLLNYAHQPLPVQIRIQGTYSLVQYESPEDAPALLPYQHRDGFTEVVVPALRSGGRIFLSNGP